MMKHNFDRAKQVLTALAHGIDPDTGADLPSQNAALQRVEVVRALLAGIAALELAAARAARRAQRPGSVGKVWSAEEERALIEAFQRGDTVETLAAQHQRTVKAIEVRLERLGLLRPSDRTMNEKPRSRAIKDPGR